MKNCKLIATIPAMTDLKKVKKIINNPFIFGVRWNTGIVSPYDEKETLQILKDFCENAKKVFWVDLKGRQLRVVEWGNPLYNSIKLNHNVKVEGSAKVLLRGENPLDLVVAKGNEVFVNPIPKHAVGAGQSVNIIGDKVDIEGYLTEKDKRYIEVSKQLGISNIMASFVESINDVVEIKMAHGSCDVVCKIESKKGVSNLSDLVGLHLMAARDDLYLELGNPYYMNYALNSIIKQDENAICASRIFTSLEHSNTISFSDFEDLENMYAMGYRHFMLCDNVCNYCFDSAIEGWCTFLNER